MKLKVFTKILVIALSSLTFVACGGKGDSNSTGSYGYRYDRFYDGRYNNGPLQDVGTGYNQYSDTDMTLAISVNGAIRGDMFVGMENIPGCYIPYGRYDLFTYQSPGIYNPMARTVQGASVIGDRGDVQILMNIQYATFTDPNRMAAQVNIVSVNGYPCASSIFFGMW